MSATEVTEAPPLRLSVTKPNEQIATRIAELAAIDAQFQAALPIQSVSEARLRPGLGLAQIVALVMEAYADRPALAQRAVELITDPASGCTTRQLLPRFDTITYRDLWARARALATAWHRDPRKPLRANDFLCILAFAGIDFATVDLAAIHNGAVIVPLQTNGAMSQLLAIIKEVEPQWLATSLESLNTAVELVLNGHRPGGLLVFD
jgi:fatty acid CoA ligase FadD9